MTSSDHLETLAQTLEATGDYRVIRRLNADIGRRLAEIGRDQPIDLDHEERKAQLGREHLCAEGLAAAWRPAE